MEGLNQVSFAQAQRPQEQNKKGSYLFPAVATVTSAGVGTLAGYSAHKTAKAAIAKAAAKCDENLIRSDLAKFFHFENGIPENSKAFFEHSVKSKLNFAKECLEHTKDFYKGAGLHNGIAVGGCVALAFGLYKLITTLMTNHKKEA